MIFIVVTDYGAYDGGDVVRYASLDKAKAAIWLADHIKEYSCLVIREYKLDTLLDKN